MSNKKRGRNNIYQITPLEELSGHPDPEKIIDFLGSKMKPDRYQNDTCIGSNMKLSLVSNRYPNNTNIITTTNREKDAVVAVVKNCIILLKLDKAYCNIF